MDDFFMADPDAPRLSQKKRKRQQAAVGKEQKAKTRASSKRDDAGSGSDHEVGGAETVDDMDLVGDRNVAEESDSEAERETAAQKRLRLAKRYLAKVREEAGGEEGEVDAADLDRDIIADRLRDEALEAVGRLHHAIADKYTDVDFADPSRVRTFKHGQTLHSLAITCLAIASPADTSRTTDLSSRKPLYVYSASKDASIVKWDFWTGKRVHFTPGGLKPTKKLTAAYGSRIAAAHKGHSDHILSLAVSSDGQFLATGGRDKAINIWSVADDKHLTVFKQHRDAVAGLAFRKGQNQLYSASLDRTIKLWNIDEMSYVETLYGHQDQITCIDTLARERCITSGSRDRTCRLWKIIEESQLIFRGGGSGTHESAGEDLVVMDGVKKVPKLDKQAGLAGGSLDVVAMLDEEYFVSGSDTGAISLWNINRKKPMFTKLRAHGPGSKLTHGHSTPENPAPTADGAFPEGGCGGITSLAAVKYSDMFASGSADGYIRLWKVDNKKKFHLIGSIPMAGFINSLAFLEAATVPSPDASLATPTPGNTSTPAPRNTAEARLARAKAALASGAPVDGSAPTSKKDLLYLVAGVGQEHRLGRWWRYKGVRNAVKVVTLG
ncbi:pre-rRNA processing protein [Thoreauomyces humboldtii]|nr:pre-rRNA processing protein [Thoreauomyces humboldtii]